MPPSLPLSLFLVIVANGNGMLRKRASAEEAAGTMTGLTTEKEWEEARATSNVAAAGGRKRRQGYHITIQIQNRTKPGRGKDSKI